MARLGSAQRFEDLQGSKVRAKDAKASGRAFGVRFGFGQESCMVFGPMNASLEMVLTDWNW